jgi:hypothetical protein
MRGLKSGMLALALLAVVSTGHAQEGQQFVGEWILALDLTEQDLSVGTGRGREFERELQAMDPTGRHIVYAKLTIERGDADSPLDVYIDGGIVELVDLGGDRIRFTFDWTQSSDRLQLRHMAGVLNDGVITGDMIVWNPTGEEREEHEARFGAWQAIKLEREVIESLKGDLSIPVPEAVIKSRIAQVEDGPDPADPQPFDIEGIWHHATYAATGTNKSRFTFTDIGARVDALYDPLMDDITLRCMNDGLLRMEFGPFGVEFMVQEAPEEGAGVRGRFDKIVMIYEDYGVQRRIYMDDRDFPKEVVQREPMGYSIGRWEGPVLVVETRHLSPALWDSDATPFSDEFWVEERRYLDEFGRLHNEVTVHDPINLKRPAFQHLYRVPAPNGYEFTEYHCDPDDFYRYLYENELFDEYIERSRYRYGLSTPPALRELYRNAPR